MPDNSNPTNRKGSPPDLKQSSLNLSKKPSGGRDSMFFWVSPEFKREFRIFAAERDMSMVEVLIQSFEEFKANHR